MPKMKSHKGAAKRFTKTAGGFKKRRCNRSHCNTKMSAKRLRSLRSNNLTHASDMKSLVRALGSL